jgi:hypothetical protein
MNRPRLLVAALGIGLSALAVWVLLRQTDLHELAHQLRSARPGWLLAGCIVTLLGYALRARRWGVLLAPYARVSEGRLFGATVVGFLAINTLPARLGELVRAYVLSRTERIPIGIVLGSVVMERIFDLVALGAFWALSLLFAPYPDWFRWSGYLTLAGGVVLVGTLWWLHAAHVNEHAALGRIMGLLPAGVRGPVSSGVASFSQGLAGIRRPSTILLAALVSAIQWVVAGSVFLIVGQSMGLGLPWWSPFLLAFVVCVAIMLPSSPGFIGVLEASCVVGVGLLGVDASRGLAFGILYHVTQLAPLVVVGSYYAVRGRMGPELWTGPGRAPAPPEGKKR